MSAAAQTLMPVEFKGRMLTVSLLRISSADPAEISAAITERLQRGGALLREMPVVLELLAAVELPALLAQLRAQGLKPFALLQPVPALAETAAGLGLITLDSLGASRERNVAAAEAAATAAEPAKAATRPPAMVIQDPVRSGQQIYARDTDLVVLNTVGAGAEVIADGSIHIYGALRGRALAGARGDGSARVYCQQFAAELVAVAGCYKLTEEMPADLRRRILGQATQVRLEGDALKMELLPQN